MTRIDQWLALVSVALLTGGCALLGGAPPERYGGSATLTQAAGEAAKDSTEKRRRLDVGDRVPTEPGGIEVGAGLTNDESEEPGSAPHAAGERTHWVLGAVGGGGSLGSQEFEGFGFGGLDIGAFAADGLRLDLGLLILSPNLSATSLAGQGLKDEMELAADFSARYYLTPPHTFLGIYPLAGLRFGTLFWSYRTPVNVIADGAPKTIEDDWLNYYALYGGLGVSLAQTRHFSTGLNLTIGFRAYDQTTFEGFHNTLFPTTGYSQIGFEITYKF